MSFLLGLSDAQLAERKLRLHAGDSDDIMAGEYRRPYRRIVLGENNDLWSDLPWFMRKNLTPEHLAFMAARGNLTEPFNLAYTMQRTGRPITYYSANTMMLTIWNNLTGGADADARELVVSKRYPFMAANLDGMTTTPQGHRCVIDAKDISRVTEAEMVLRFTARGVWQATCAGTDWWALAPIVGGKWEPPIYQAVDPIYQATMTKRAKECWGFIERGEEPPDAETVVLPPKPQPRLREILVPVDTGDVFQALCRENNWLGEACKEIAVFFDTQPAATKHAICREELKRLVPEDVGKLRRGRFTLSRTKAGAVTMALTKMEDDDNGR